MLSTSNNHVILPINNVVITLLIPLHHVPRSEKTILKRLRSLLRKPIVLIKHHGTSRIQLPNSANRHLLSLLIKKLNDISPETLPPHGTQLPQLILRLQNRDKPRLRWTVSLIQLNIRETLQNPLLNMTPHRGRRTQELPYRTHVVFPPLLLRNIQYQIIVRRYQRRESYLLLTYHTQKLNRVKPLIPSNIERRPNIQEQGTVKSRIHMIQGHDNHPVILLREAKLHSID